MGRILLGTHVSSRNFASRKPNSFPPSTSSFAAETTTPYPVFYNSITTSTPGPLTIYQRTSFALLRGRIQQIRRELDFVSRDLLETHLQLANTVSKSDWFLIEQVTFYKATRVGDDIKARQRQKFARLTKIQHPATTCSCTLWRKYFIFYQ